MTADIAVGALANAKARGCITEGAIFHSDKGAQRASRLLAERAQDNDVRLSCSRTGSCHDNAVAESFFATLKNEMRYRRSFVTREQAKMAVTELIEVYCSRKRPHSTIDRKIPAQVIDAFFKRTKPMAERNAENGMKSQAFVSEILTQVSAGASLRRLPHQACRRCAVRKG